MSKQIKNYHITNFKNRSRAMKKLTLISLIFILLVLHVLSAIII